MENVGFFSADYRDGRARIGSKSYSAGYFAEHLLNQYYKDDTAARIAVFKRDNWVLQDSLTAGFLNIHLGKISRHFTAERRLCGFRAGRVSHLLFDEEDECRHLRPQVRFRPGTISIYASNNFS